MKDKGNADAEILLKEWDPSTSLTCSSYCNPVCNISWYKDGKQLSHKRNKMFSIGSQRRNSGNYECKASGIEGTVYSKQVKVTVQCKYQLYVTIFSSVSLTSR